MDFHLNAFVTGPLQVNTYVFGDGGHCVVVDPSGLTRDLQAAIDNLDGEDVAIWLTHGHGDHIGAVNTLRAHRPNCSLHCPAADAVMLTDAIANLSGLMGQPILADTPDHLISDGDVLTVGRTQWLAMDTSGHTPGGLSYYCESAAIVLTGDALFAGGIGRTDIPGGSTEQLLTNIRDRLLSLPDETQVLPGHGPATTIGRERASNPFLQSL